MLSTLFIDREDTVIDSMRTRTDNVSPDVSHADTAGVDLMHVVPVDASTLPNPAVGGEQGSRIRNGFSTGIRSLFTRQQPFSGAVATPPAIDNPVIGEVGQNNGAGKLYAGVMNQAVQYSGAMGALNINYVTGK